MRGVGAVFMLVPMFVLMPAPSPPYWFVQGANTDLYLGLRSGSCSCLCLYFCHQPKSSLLISIREAGRLSHDISDNVSKYAGMETTGSPPEFLYNFLLLLAGLQLLSLLCASSVARLPDLPGRCQPPAQVAAEWPARRPQSNRFPQAVVSRARQYNRYL